jgi:ribosomal protein S7
MTDDLYSKMFANFAPEQLEALTKMFGGTTPSMPDFSTFVPPAPPAQVVVDVAEHCADHVLIQWLVATAVKYEAERSGSPPREIINKIASELADSINAASYSASGLDENEFRQKVIEKMTNTLRGIKY